MKRQQYLWLLVIPVLLLAAGLAVHRLNGYPLYGDEWYSLRVAGGRYHGPLGLAEVWERVANIDPDQAHGLSLIYSLWGRVFGWSEFGMRILPFFAGLLAISWNFRVGRDLFAPLVGLIASILLATSVFFVNYMHVGRAYSLVALFTGMTVWGYWRTTQIRPGRDSSRVGQLCFLLGSIGISYTNYYAIMLLVALGLWHLLFMPKDRRWWRPVILLMLAGVVFLPALRSFLRGIDKTQTASWFTQDVLRTGEVLPWYLYVLTNGILRFPSVPLSLVPSVVGLAFLTMALAIGWWRSRRSEWLRQARFLLFIAFATLLLMLWANEILQIMRPNRLRYMMALWPMSALLIGWGIWRTRGHWRLVAAFCMGAFFVYGIWANAASELRYEFNSLLERYTVHPLSKDIAPHAFQRDLLLIGAQSHQAARSAGYYFAPFPQKHLVLEDAPDSRREFPQAAEEHLRILLLAGEVDGKEHREMIAQLPYGMIFCERIIDREDLVLELYGWSRVFCPSDAPAQMRFGEEIELTASEVEVVSRDILRIDLLLQSEENTAMTAYSVAIHVFEVESGAKVAQSDQGLWLGRYNPVRSEIDISALGAGEYEVRVGVYNWQTLERLEGVDLTNDAAANLLTLSRFQVE